MKIVAILKEHDLMGSVMIAGKERSGFFNEISPTWSCASVNEGPAGLEVRVRAKREDFASVEEQKACLAATVNGLMGLLHVHKFIGEMLLGMVKLISTKVDITSIATDERFQTVRATDGREGR